MSRERRYSDTAPEVPWETVDGCEGWQLLRVFRVGSQVLVRDPGRNYILVDFYSGEKRISDNVEQLPSAVRAAVEARRDEPVFAQLQWVVSEENGIQSVVDMPNCYRFLALPAFNIEGKKYLLQAHHDFPRKGSNWLYDETDTAWTMHSLHETIEGREVPGATSWPLIPLPTNPDGSPKSAIDFINELG